MAGRVKRRRSALRPSGSSLIPPYTSCEVLGKVLSPCFNFLIYKIGIIVLPFRVAVRIKWASEWKTLKVGFDKWWTQWVVTAINIHDNWARQSCLLLVILNCGGYIVFFCKIVPIDEKILQFLQKLTCYLVRKWLYLLTLNRWNVLSYGWTTVDPAEPGGPSLDFMYGLSERTLQVLIPHAVSLLCVGLTCYVSAFLVVYCWAIIVFKWFISYDDSFCFV